ncbi:MAG TPA: ImmA/IrrE family metallo-endopeptidase [Propionicimonas sp.]|jgi:Zn-dependent peptidase ImmA (M78 family)
MRRGFKTEAKALALELRAEIGLGPHVPFDPYALAAEYGITVVPLSELTCDGRDRFLQRDDSPLSGALIPDGTSVIILDNDAQLLARRRNTMSHELAHVVLEHEFGVSLADERKCGLGGAQEEEADWLAGELLVPYNAALNLARGGATDDIVARRMEVSLAVARWRMNGSGARKVVARTHHRRAAARG